MALFPLLKLGRKKPKKAAPTPPPLSWPSPSARRQSERGTRSKLPRFHTTAGDHIERDIGERLARERVKLRNAFTPAQPVADARMFAGRSRTLEHMIRAIEDQRLHLVIFGERGVGKTSLLNMLSATAQEARYIVVYMSCGSSSAFDDTFRTAAAAVPLIFHSSVSPVSATSNVGTTLADLLAEGYLTPRRFAEAAAKLVGTRVIILLDEFDRTESQAFRRDVAELIKSLSDMSARLQLVIAGVAADLIDLLEHIPSIRRSVSAVRIPAMEEAEIRELIANGERSSGMFFDDEAKDLVIDAAAGSPYLANLVCQQAGLTALARGRIRVQTSDILESVEQAMDELRSRLPSDVANRLDAIADSVGALGSKTLKRAGSREDVLPNASEITSLLEKSGMFRAESPAYSALVTDSLMPYLQLKKARERYMNAGAVSEKVAT